MSREPSRVLSWRGLLPRLSIGVILAVGFYFLLSAWQAGKLAWPRIDIEQRRRGNLIHLKGMLVVYLDAASHRPEMFETGDQHPLVAVVRADGPWAYLLVSPLVKVVKEDFSFAELTDDLISYDSWPLKDIQRLRDYRKCDPHFNALLIWETTPGNDGKRYAVVDLGTVVLTQGEFERRKVETAALLAKLRTQ